MSKWDSQAILGLARSYWECRVLLSATELDLFTRLKDLPLGAEELASRIGAKTRGLTMLLDAVAALGLLVKRDDKYFCEPETAALLSGSGPGAVTPMVLHSANQWPKWSDLTGIVRGEIEPGRHPRTPETLRAFIEAMDVVAPPIADATARSIDLSSARRLLDVGGGPGTFTAAFLQAAPKLEATLFDMPDVIEIARERLERAKLLDRVTLVEGDFYTDELPGGHDLVLLSAVIHQNNPDQNLALYEKAYRALTHGGRVVIRDHILTHDRTHPPGAAVFAINMLVSTAGGNCYTCEEITRGLNQAGFRNIELLSPDERMTGLIQAVRP